MRRRFALVVISAKTGEEIQRIRNTGSSARHGEFRAAFWYKDHLVTEVPIHYRARGEGSVSKLSTVRDGYRILIALLAFFRDYRPLTCFGVLALFLFLCSAVTGGIVVGQYIETGQVLRIPMAILSVGLALLGAISLMGGLFLSSVSRRSQQLAALIIRQ